MFPCKSKLRFRFKQLGGLSLILLFAGDPPLRAYVTARSALQAARTHEAQRFASAAFLQAEQAYKTGEKAFADERYTEAKEQFNISRRLAEKAETAARVQKYKSGEAP
jgi:hypothetical protein